MVVNQNAQNTLLKKININTFLFSSMLFLVAFDFKSDGSTGASLIVIMGIIAILCGVVLVVMLRYLNKRSLILLIPSLLFIFSAIFSGMIRGQSFYDIFSLLVPLLYFCLGIVIVPSMKMTSENLKSVLNLLILFALVSVVFKLIFGFMYFGLTFENSRYQIISPALILLFSYGIASIFYKKQRWGHLAILLSIAVVFLSVTRSFILIFLSVIMFWILTLPLHYWKKNLRIIVKIFFFILLSILFLYLFIPEVFDRWHYRLFTGVSEQGIDVTEVTRIAEAHFQITKLLDNPINFMFGLGIAAETRFPDEYIEVLRIVFSDDYEYVGKGFGHNNYIGILFTGGVVFGGLLIYTILTLIKRSIFLFKYELKKETARSDSYFSIAWGTSVAIGYSMYGLLGGVFGDRLSSLSFGIAFGLIFLGERLILIDEKK